MKPVEQMTHEEKLNHLFKNLIDHDLFAKILLDSEKRKAEKQAIEKQKAGEYYGKA